MRMRLCEFRWSSAVSLCDLRHTWDLLYTYYLCSFLYYPKTIGSVTSFAWLSDRIFVYTHTKNVEPFSSKHVFLKWDDRALATINTITIDIESRETVSCLISTCANFGAKYRRDKNPNVDTFCALASACVLFIPNVQTGWGCSIEHKGNYCFR